MTEDTVLEEEATEESPAVVEEGALTMEVTARPSAVYADILDAGDIEGLVRESQAGRLGAYRELIELNEIQLRGVLATLLPDNSKVDEAVREVFVAAYWRLKEHKPGTDFGLWLRGVCWEVALNERKRILRLWTLEKRTSVLIEWQLGSRLEAMGRLFEGGGCLAAVGARMESLPDELRDVLNARYFARLPCDRIATLQGKAADWVRLLLFRARAALGALVLGESAVPACPGWLQSQLAAYTEGVLSETRQKRLAVALRESDEARQTARTQLGMDRLLREHMKAPLDPDLALAGIRSGPRRHTATAVLGQIRAKRPAKTQVLTRVVTGEAAARKPLPWRGPSGPVPVVRQAASRRRRGLRRVARVLIPVAALLLLAVGVRIWQRRADARHPGNVARIQQAGAGSTLVREHTRRPAPDGAFIRAGDALEAGTGDGVSIGYPGGIRLDAMPDAVLSFHERVLAVSRAGDRRDAAEHATLDSGRLVAVVPASRFLVLSTPYADATLIGAEARIEVRASRPGAGFITRLEVVQGTVYVARKGDGRAVWVERGRYLELSEDGPMKALALAEP
ncbi:MAG: hypothetical protein JXR37_16485 [Kiritimatiellae bacterium]|nr:hypothetical protein [Kiritimatiellia bacterium]